MDNVALTLIVTIVIALALLTFYPDLEGLLGDVGDEMASGANYTVDDSDANTAKDVIWGAGAPLFLLALMVILFKGSGFRT